MRVFKPTYTVPRPKGSKLLRRKTGDVVQFKNPRGEEVIAPLSKSRRRVKMETSCYYLEFKDHNSIVRKLKAFTDEGSSQRVAGTIQDLLNARGSGQGLDSDLRRKIEGLDKPMRADLAKWGLLDEKANTATKPLTELVGAFIENLKARELCRQHIAKNDSDLKAVCEGCRFVFFSDITGPKVESYLKNRRDGGISYRRSNSILVSVKAFVAWLIREGVVSDNPVTHIRPLNVKEDPRHPRRALEEDELQRFLKVTRQSGKRWNLTGYERYLVYRLAVETGLRRGELMKLRAGDFDFNRASVELGASATKNKKGAKLPLRKATVSELQEYCKGLPPTATLFDLPWATSQMVRDDLTEAGIPYEDELGRFFDFHALRGQFGTLLAKRGVHPKTAQVLMRHHDVNLTLGLYTHVLHGQENAAIESLPDFSVGKDDAERKAG